MHLLQLIIVAAFLLVFGLISGRIEKTFLTAPMIFVIFGLVIGPAGLGLIEIEPESAILHTLAEATLVLVLFTDASRIDLRTLRTGFDLPARMLGIGLPLTILAGTGAALLVLPEFSPWEAAALAAILAPTDAALGQAVVSSPKVPVRIRQALNVESGLNDGIALPFVMIFVSLVAATGEAQSVSCWALYAFKQVTFGPVAGLAVGFVGGKLVERATVTDWMNDSFQRLSSLSLAFLSFGLAEQIGGNGLIAAFAAGLALGNFSRSVCGHLYEFAEAEGQFLMLLAFLVFGASNVAPAVTTPSLYCVVYAVLSLTVIRMAPISISLIGANLHHRTHLFLGWFGPRGLASILYVLLFVGQIGEAGGETVFVVVILTVFLSVLAHGLSAQPGATWYSAHCEEMLSKGGARPEHEPVAELPIRLPSRQG